MTSSPGASRLIAALALLALCAGACSRIVTLELPALNEVPVVPPEQSFVYDSEGRQLAVLRQEYRERVELDALPRHLLDAVVSAEDQRFWLHDGIDARAVARAALTNVASGDIEQGGSTITQQLVKNLYMPDDPRTPETKLREALLSRQVEDERSKDQILEEYLNTVYFGSGAYGVQAAAETYFRVDASELDLAQSALLAGLIRSPESLNPHRAEEQARDRRNWVLDRMVEEGVLDREAADAAATRPVVVQPRPPIPETREPHWVDFVIRRLLDDPRFGETESDRAQRLFGGGLRIHTTLDPVLQAEARRIIAERLPDAGDPDAAIVTIDPKSGRILAAAGSRSYEDLQFDLATQARRQPGSTFKAFVLTAAVASGMGPSSVVSGNQGVLQTVNGPWRVRNYGRASYGSITLEEATRASVNASFARMILDLGVGRVAGLAGAMGVESPINEDPPIALGAVDPGVTPLDMAAGYATLANLGTRVPATPILRVEDADGKVVYTPDDTPRPVVDPSAAFVTTEILRTVVDRGTGRAARVPGWQVAGKTGTTDDHADAWFVGYTPTLATSVWVGHAGGRVPMRWVQGFARVTGGSIPARLWRDYMTVALEDMEPEPFVLPEQHYETVDLDPETGLREAPWCPGEPTELPRAVVPDDTCPSPAPPPPSPEPEQLAEGEATPTPSPTATPSPTSTATSSPSPGSSPAPGSSPSPDASPSPEASASPSPSPSPSPRPSPTPSPATTAEDDE